MTEPDCRALIADRIRQSGPITVAAFMDLALYAPGAGYYARAAQRSGRAGDFVTSVDIGPLFGELLAVRIAEWWACVTSDADAAPSALHLIEVGAGNGRLSRDILDALSRRAPTLYTRLRLHLVERSETARAAQRETLAQHASVFASTSATVPAVDVGILVANELLDALPVHMVTMTDDGLREVYVGLDGDELAPQLGQPSTSRLAAYFEDLGIAIHPGAVVDVNLAAVDWIRSTCESVARGCLMLIDYGYDARTLYEQPDAVSTLTAFSAQMGAAAMPGPRGTPAWLDAPGTRDLTTHVDFTTIAREAERAGYATTGSSSQSRFLLDLVERSGLVPELERPDRLRDRLALKSLLVPGGLGSSHRVLLLERGVRR
jgi:SAM-dependent MidA family methyltransferase